MDLMPANSLRARSATFWSTHWAWGAARAGDRRDVQDRDGRVLLLAALFGQFSFPLPPACLDPRLAQKTL
jgi:hypothetical protein